MRPRSVAVLHCAAAAVLAMTGCESTIDAARKIAVQGTRAFEAKGLRVTSIDRKIRVLSTAIVHDANGTAVTVALRNTGRTPMVAAPIAIEVLDTAGRTVFQNNAPGLEPDLSHVPLLPPGQTVDWVNDQVLTSGVAKRLVTRIGAGQNLRGAVPKIQTSSVSLAYDPASGYVASGTVHNASRVMQSHLVLFAVGRAHGMVVTAGRAIVPRLAPGQRKPFHAYLIGNPRGAHIIVSAPPSDLA